MNRHIFYPKLLSTLKMGYGKKMLTQDILAGIIVGIVALPLSIAFAVASGVSPEKGLITAVVAGFIISLLGGSRVQIGGPTGAFIVIVVGIIQKYGIEGLMISTMLAGVFMILFGLLRLGTLLKYIPHPLVVGFTSGIALVIFSTQIKDALGLEVNAIPSNFIEKWGFYFENLSSVNIYAIGITILTILISIYSSKWIPKVPGSFIAILVTTALVKIFTLPVTTIETIYGSIPSNIEMHLPMIQWSQIPSYIEPAITIALLGSIESLLSAVVSDGMIGGNHRSNTELIAQGVANIITPFFGGIPATGAIARTATNVKNGGRTPIAGIAHAMTLLLIMLFFGPWVKWIPMSALAGILIVVSYNMSEWRSFKGILKTSYFDILVLLSTFFLTVLVDLTIAIEVGMVLSALLFMKRMADQMGLQQEVDKDVLENDDKLPEGIKAYEISGPFFFGSARNYCNMIQNVHPKTKILILRMRHVPFIDATGAHHLKECLFDLTHKGVDYRISGTNEAVKKELISMGVESSKIYDHFEEVIK
ncbi:STAS domain-containing protein [Halosquirtibacter laminarini]|uniref:STAS domain-containing protein n=1 Tax=Halosquirtibacter laminarini TaxID=3374600 RepID=A0AC61NJB8_9BACT|nr:STAS domain-containing protein [Prolixibacteraceae bacterium]